MDRGAWQAAVHGVAKSQTRLSNYTFIFIINHNGKEEDVCVCVCVYNWILCCTAEINIVDQLYFNKILYIHVYVYV